MRKGGGKAKGSSFERKICVALSLWVSRGTKKDLFWRSAMSGGRATVLKRVGTNIRQAGDICAVAPEGHALTDVFLIECKHYRKLDIASFLLDNTGELAKFWGKTCGQAKDHMRQPLLIAQENRRKPIVVCRHRGLQEWTSDSPAVISNWVEVRYLKEVFHNGGST